MGFFPESHTDFSIVPGSRSSVKCGRACETEPAKDCAPQRPAVEIPADADLRVIVIANRAELVELRPESPENEGLQAALQKHAAALKARHAIETELDLSDEPTVPMPVKEALYRIAQEAMHNVVKHARAGTVTLRLVTGADRLTLEIGDDGVGFDPAGEFPGHLGLHSMRERLAPLSGSLEIESAPGQGARIRAMVPLDPTAG
jgi:signal transduction histidine kinase